MLDYTWVNYFYDLFQDFRDLDVIVENIDNDAHKRVENLRILDTIEESLG